jgi:hypothetical protein
MGISGSTSDAQIDLIVASVDAAIKKYLGRQIETAAITGEYYDGNGIDDFIVLSDYPVTAVASVAIDGTTLSSGSYAFDSATGRLFYKPGGSSYGAWPAGRRNILVTFTAGYASVPGDLALAATKQCVYEAKLSNVQGGRLGDRSTIMQDGGTAQYVIAGWYPGVQEVLDAYRSPRCR